MRMNRKLKITCLLLLVIGMVACKNDSDNMAIEPPTATFSIEGDVLNSAIGDVFELTAHTQPKENVKSKWYIDGVLESITETLKIEFTTPGTKSIRYVARNVAGEFIKEITVEVADDLKISLSIGDVDEIERFQNDELEVSAMISAGSDVTHKWEVDGTEVGNEQALEGFILKEIKTYHVKYTGSNAIKTYIKEFDVIVLPRPLEVSLSVEEGTINILQKQKLDIEAEVLNGDIGVTHEWKVNGNIVSTTNIFTYNFDNAGIFEVTYKCANSMNETVTKTWTVEVKLAYFLLDNFESGALSINFKGGGSTAVLEVVDNPLVTGLNTSDKVLKLTKSFASQQLNIYIKRASNPTVDISDKIWGKGFDRVRFMYYNTNTTGRFVSWKMNGNDPVLTITPQPEFGVWSYVDISLTTAQMNSLTSLNLRLNDGTGNSDDIIYIDNVEFYNSEAEK